MTEFERLRSTLGELGIPLVIDEEPGYDIIALDVYGYPDIIRLLDSSECSVEFYFETDGTFRFAKINNVSGLM